MRLTLAQIEQFIESIFPSQKPPADVKSPASVEEAEKAKKQAYEDKWDLIYMSSAVILTVLVITSCMVSNNVFAEASSNMIQIFVAYLAGARFDIAYYQFKEQIGELLGWSASNATAAVEVTSKIVEAVPTHGEL